MPHINLINGIIVRIPHIMAVNQASPQHFLNSTSRFEIEHPILDIVTTQMFLKIKYSINSID